jgi:alpha-beta hydrolase superfamily lysophospholipase
MATFKTIQPVEGERLSCRGEKLFTVRYTPTTTTRAVMIFSHGYAEHVGRYAWGAQSHNGAETQLS